MEFLKIKKTGNDRIKRIEELEKRIKKIEETPSESNTKKISELTGLLKPKKETEKPEKILEEVHNAVKEAVEMGTIKIDTTVKDIMTAGVKTVQPEDDLRKVLSILSE
jgi:CBS-domain-containing membrane protein